MLIQSAKNTGVGFLLVLIWLLFSKQNLVNPLLFPSPIKVAEDMVLLFNQESILSDIWATISRIIIGIIFGVVAGVVSGILVGASDKIYRLTIHWIDFFRSIPPVALLPIFTLLFGIGNQTKIALCIFITGFITLIHTIYGISNANKDRLNAAKSMQLKKMSIFFKVALPEALPHISVGIRTSISFGLMAVILSEMMISTKLGIGSKIIEYQLTFETGKMYACIIITGLIGYIMNAIYLTAEKKYIHWGGK